MSAIYTATDTSVSVGTKNMVLAFAYDKDVDRWRYDIVVCGEVAESNVHDEFVEALETARASLLRMQGEAMQLHIGLISGIQRVSAEAGAIMLRCDGESFEQGCG